MPSTTYDWIIAAVDSFNGISGISAYTAITSFTTTASGIIASGNDAADNLNINSVKNGSLISVSPNPATDYFIIRLNNAVSEKLAAILYNTNGKAVWTSGSVNATALKSTQVLTNEFGSGVYHLKIINEQGAVIAQTRVSVIK